MHLIFRVLETGLALWFVLLAAIVIWRMLVGAIDMRGMLQHGPGEGVAPERLVALIAFPTVVVSYVLGAMHADLSAAHSLPDLSDKMILLLTGGNGLYLAGKIART
jgi:hypothetical protein